MVIRQSREKNMAYGTNLRAFVEVGRQVPQNRVDEVKSYI